MKLILWLWNPWKKYESTRHNVGFILCDLLQEKYGFSDFGIEWKFKASISNWTLNWEKTLLVKPQTFMNLSWEALSLVMHYYKIPPEDIIVVYDDVSMDFWKIRFREKWRAGWHNWIKDIIKKIWEEFPRVKIGVWHDSRYEMSDWVLWKFSEEELIDIDNEIYDWMLKHIIST